MTIPVTSVNVVATSGDLLTQWPMELQPLVQLLKEEISKIVEGTQEEYVKTTTNAAGEEEHTVEKYVDAAGNPAPKDKAAVMMGNEMFEKFCEAIAKAVLGYLRDHGSLRLSAIEQAMADITFLASNPDPNTFLKGQTGLDLCTTMTPGTDPEGDNRGTFAISKNL